MAELHLCGMELNSLYGDVLFKILPALGAGDRYDVVALLQQPGKRDLPRFRLLSRRDLVYDFRRFHIGVVASASITWIAAPKITLRMFFCAFDFNG